MRTPNHLYRIINEIDRQGLATPQLIIGIEEYGKGIKKGTLRINAPTREQAAQRIKTMLYGLQGDLDTLTEQIMDMENREKIDRSSEFGLRGRLEAEMRICMINEGIEINGKPTSDVPGWVRSEFLQKHPGLEQQVQQLRERFPSTTEGNSPLVVDLGPDEYRI